MELLFGTDVISYLGLDAVGARCAVGDVSARGHILQAVVAGGRVEGYVPCGTVVLGCLIGTHGHPLQVARLVDAQELGRDAQLLVLQIILGVVILLEHVGRGGKLSRSRCQSILAQGFCQQRVGDIEILGSVILVRTVYAVWPHVGAVAVELTGRVVIPEAQGTRCSASQPVAVGGVGTQEGIVLPGADGSHAYGMEHFVEQGSRALVRGVRSYPHPSAIAAVGSRCAGTIVDGEMKSVDAGVFIPEVDGFLDRTLNTGIGIARETFNAVGDASARTGYRLHRVAIYHGAILLHHVGTDIIYGGWLQARHIIDVTIVAQIGLGGSIFYGWVGMGRRVAESLLLDGAGGDAAHVHSTIDVCGAAQPNLVGLHHVGSKGWGYGSHRSQRQRQHYF